jgi:hypothetical protein
MSASHCETCG